MSQAPLDCCPYCGPAAAEPFRPAQACAGGPPRDFFRCSACATVFPRPRLGAALSADALAALDAKERKLEPAVSLKDPLCRLLRAEVPLRGAALDVGSATGGFCAALDALGFEAHGLEPQPSARRLAAERGTRAHAGLFPDDVPPQVAGRRFALVSVLEAVYYFPDLKRALARVQELLEPGGWLLIKAHHAEAPCYADGRRSLFSRLGDHVQGAVTEESLRRCLDASGFELRALHGLAERPGLLGRAFVRLRPWAAPKSADRLVALARRR